MEIAVNFPLLLTPRLPNPLAVAMPKLTKRFVDSLARPPAGRDLYVWDSEVDEQRRLRATEDLVTQVGIERDQAGQGSPPLVAMAMT